MALIQAISFDSVTAKADLLNYGLDLSDANWTYESAGGVNSGGAMKCVIDDTTAAWSFRPGLTSPTSDQRKLRFSLWFKSGGTPGAEDHFMMFADTANPSYMSVTILSSGELKVYKASNTAWYLSAGTLSTSASAGLHDGSWHFIEFYIFSNNTSSVVQVWIDNVLQINWAGDIGQIASNTYRIHYISRIDFRTPDTDGSFDDIMLWNDVAGDMTGALGGIPVMYVLGVSGAGSSADWSPSAGSNYQNVDESGYHDSDTTYNSSNTSADKDLYAMANLPVTPTSIKGVIVQGVLKSDSGTGQFKFKVKSGTTEGDSDTKDILVPSYRTYQAMFLQNPDTAAAWTESGVNGMEAGVELI